MNALPYILIIICAFFIKGGVEASHGQPLFALIFFIFAFFVGVSAISMIAREE